MISPIALKAASRIDTLSAIELRGSALSRADDDDAQLIEIEPRAARARPNAARLTRVMRSTAADDKNKSRGSELIRTAAVSIECLGD